MEKQTDNKVLQTADPKVNILRFSNIFCIILGAISSLAWVIVFGMGMLVDSKPFRDRVAAGFDPAAFGMCILVFTPTNIFLLCMVSAIAGGCASRLLVNGAKKLIGEQTSDQKLEDSHIYLVENPFSSMMRGMVVYFSFLAGVFVAGSQLLVQPTQQGYTQAAGVVSLLSFLVGYDPTLFSSFIKVANKVQPK